MRTHFLNNAQFSEHAHSPRRLFVPGPQHVAGGMLCGVVQTVGGRAASAALGVAAIWHWRRCHAALAQITAE